MPISSSIVNKYALQVSTTLKTVKSFKKGLQYNQGCQKVLKYTAELSK